MMNSDTEKVLDLALEIGGELASSGMEINKVEDAMVRICFAYCLEDINAIAAGTMLAVSATDSDDHTVTKIRRIYEKGYNMNRIEQLLGYSRKVCINKVEPTVALTNLKDIVRNTKTNPLYVAIGYVIIPAAFCIYYGGNIQDSLCSAFIGIIIFLCNRELRPSLSNNIVYAVFVAVLSGILAVILTSLGVGVNEDKIMIGDIMVLIPTLALVNSLKDMMRGDLMSGIMRFFEVFLEVTALASGFGLALVLVGYIF